MKIEGVKDIHNMKESTVTTGPSPRYSGGATVQERIKVLRGRLDVPSPRLRK